MLLRVSPPERAVRAATGWLEVVTISRERKGGKVWSGVQVYFCYYSAGKELRRYIKKRCLAAVRQSVEKKSSVKQTLDLIN